MRPGWPILKKYILCFASVSLTMLNLGPRLGLGVERVEVVQGFLVDGDALPAAEDEDLRPDAGLRVSDAVRRNLVDADVGGDVDILPPELFGRREVDAMDS